MSTELTRHVSLRAGPWALQSLVKHYFRDKKSKAKEDGESLTDDLLYNEIFHFIKSMVKAATKHTIEDLQQLTNARTPTVPWMIKTPVVIPMEVCKEAAKKLVEVLGGEEKTCQLVGGMVWWQVRGIKGINAQWIVAKKDHQRIKEERRERRKSEKSRRPVSENEDEVSEYEPEMNELPCILYFHGGAYFFGSIDAERYSIQRMSRKSNCRILTVSYRLAPQYPFPCALQDALAAYLYLIRPPSDAKHAPVDPKQLIISGDSSGGGLTLALLQVIRDLELPRPAGGIVISPWCDLTHSFPSIHTNTDTDVIPKYGISIFRPSVLWPPPSDAHTDEMQATIRRHVSKASGHGHKGRSHHGERHTDHGKRDNASASGSNGPNASKETLAELAKSGDVRAAAVKKSGLSSSPHRDGQHKAPLNTGSSASLPIAGKTSDQTMRVKTENGDVLEVHEQLHMYAPNSLLTHPLVSPALSYLGGLPPLFVVAGDGEALRDEIIYAAHKAADPKRYSVKSEARKLYPKLDGIEGRFGPTKVHLQVYDVRAILLRCDDDVQQVCVGTLPPESESSTDDEQSPRKQKAERSGSISGTASKESRRSSGTIGKAIESARRLSQSQPITDSDKRASSHTKKVRLAGDPGIYQQIPEESNSPFVGHIIRERVSAQGEVRPLEEPGKLGACTMPLESVGVVSELVLRRYIEGKTKWNERFARDKGTIKKKRETSLEHVEKVPVKTIKELQESLLQKGVEQKQGGATAEAGASASCSEASWVWAWAEDPEERPPPSSIVARLDTEEALQLAKTADEPPADPSRTSLWSEIVRRIGSGGSEKGGSEVKRRGSQRASKSGWAESSHDSDHQLEKTLSRSASQTHRHSRGSGSLSHLKRVSGQEQSPRQSTTQH